MSRLTCLLTLTATVALAACGGGDAPEVRSKPPTPVTESAPGTTSTPDTGSQLDLTHVDLQGIAVASDGSVLAADAADSRILRVTRAGEITHFAGEPGFHGLAGDGGPAADARLRGPTGLAVDATGNVYITDHGNHRIRKVTQDGTITTVVGSGSTESASGGFSGDGGPAIEARLREPVAVALDRSRRMYIADRDNYRVRAVEPDGTITTLAGDGSIGPARTEGPAANAALGLPVGVAAGPDGTVYIADEVAHQVFKVGTDGVMTAFAGTGKPGYGGDDGPAVDARLNGPYGLATDAHGTVYIADLENHAIRAVDRKGVIRTVAGTGEEGFRGDGRAAIKARLSGPYGVAVDGSGLLYIADTGNARIRRVNRSRVITTILP